MKNIHILSTDKPSRLNIFCNEFTLFKNLTIDKRCKHIYITSDEFIEEVDFGLHLSTKKIVQYDGIKGLDSYYKKIILTTDQDLIKDGVQSIDDEFLEWFIKNSNCEKVKIDYIWESCLNCEWNHDMCPNVKECLKSKYKIIIPKQEAKQETLGYICPQTKKQCDDECCVSAENCQIKASIGVIHDPKPKQETLEEAAEIFVDNRFTKQICGDEFYPDIYASKSSIVESHILFAKWQQERMYSEEEVTIMLNKFGNNVYGNYTRNEMMCDFVEQWFKQFKKK